MNNNDIQKIATRKIVASIGYNYKEETEVFKWAYEQIEAKKKTPIKLHYECDPQGYEGYSCPNCYEYYEHNIGGKSECKCGQVLLPGDKKK